MFGNLVLGETTAAALTWSWTSHVLCFLCDVPLGGALLFFLVRRYRREGQERLKLAMATSGFTVLHGFGHLMIGSKGGEELIAQGKQAPVCSFVALLCFLLLGPYLGYLNGLRPRVCV